MRFVHTYNVLLVLFRLASCMILMLRHQLSVNFWRTWMVTMLDLSCLWHCLTVTKNFENCWIWIRAFYLLIPMVKKSSSILRSEWQTHGPLPHYYWTLYSQTRYPQPFFASEGMNYCYVLHKSGKGLFAFPRVVQEKMGIRQKEGYSYHHLMILRRVYLKFGGTSLYLILLNGWFYCLSLRMKW